MKCVPVAKAAKAAEATDRSVVFPTMTSAEQRHPATGFRARRMRGRRDDRWKDTSGAAGAALVEGAARLRRPGRRRACLRGS